MIQLGMPKSAFGGGCRALKPRAPISYCGILFTSDVQQESQDPMNGGFRIGSCQIAFLKTVEQFL